MNLDSAVKGLVFHGRCSEEGLWPSPKRRRRFTRWVKGILALQRTEVGCGFSGFCAKSKATMELAARLLLVVYNL